MINKMKNWPLSIQIWVVFAAITLGISLILSFILPLTLRDFFTNEIYITIESAQTLLFNQYDLRSIMDLLESQGPEKSRQTLENIRTVNHFIVYEDSPIIFSYTFPLDFLNEVRNQALTQKNNSERYSGKVGTEKIFYVITKGKALNQNAYLVSYMWDSYREDLVQTLFRKLAIAMFLVFILSWIPAILLARHLSSPLVSLEKRVGKLANNEWDEPVELDRSDEIGKLGESIERLRNQLIYQQEMQQSFLQHVSHELKTPVMVIRSFSQAIRDGIYPKGDLNCSVKVIDEEAERLEKRIRNLLYITKLDYLNNYNILYATFSLDELIKDVIDRLSWSRTDIDWRLDLPPTNIKGDVEQWRVVVENLLDNQIRYAKNSISISLKNIDDKVLLRFWNNGPNIEPETLNSLFTKFNKGYKGEFGLGLAIAQRIITLHGGKIWAENEKEGVSFYVEIPMY
ncbi:HAMP domain-containing sensor histidine kinase [Tepidimicrobium xylanilyticum]|uniref:HAMP domain-containing sensor histidine kinase n=1 Tax=Tepidimicrobium xylanilyticum TaxID=1123352 RepID=UPI002656A01F|nr:HAMP domain-containing sensor histidine kinase [Tepidimicrobium xylanilyticum]GMG97394.1 sensor histidine kinase CssS [Tepidimicrobium xylanilyticum]